MVKPIVLFDLDGTLIDSTDSILYSFKSAFYSLKIDYPGDDSVKSLIGYPLDSMFVRLTNRPDLSGDFVEFYKKTYIGIYLEGTSFLPYAKNAILNAFEFANIGVVTTKSFKQSKILLEHLGVLKYFRTIVGKESVNRLKPSSEPILKAICDINFGFTNVTNLDMFSMLNRQILDNSFMIGDTKLDSISAREAGINSYCVLCGYGTNLHKYCDNIFNNAFEAVSSIQHIYNS